MKTLIRNIEIIVTTYYVYYTFFIFNFQDSCIAVAMLAFYFYLSVFFWMLVEGVYIYMMVIKVFRGNVARRRRIAYVVGWGEHFKIELDKQYFLFI